MRHILSILVGLLLLSAFVCQTNAGTQQYEMTLKIDSIKVFKDHDPIGAGEIFYTVQVNDQDKFRSVEMAMNDGESYPVNRDYHLVVEQSDTIKIELRENDKGIDDTLGYVIVPLTNSTQTTETTSTPGHGQITFSATVRLVETTETDPAITGFETFMKILLFIAIAGLFVYGIYKITQPPSNRRIFL